ncbi:MAG TPA: PQQ-binding-like beta-propeller repeat protein [Caulifigura sp.]|nr:PQQ-binding-like beta-propeller repeat protein [Caulifigura sp.]
MLCFLVGCGKSTEAPAAKPETPAVVQVAASDAPTANADGPKPDAPASDPLAASTEPGFDWPCFLGPDHNCVSKETGLLETWPQEGPPLVWSKKVGEGHGAPSVLGQRLVLHHYEQRKEVVECFHALTGESLWTHKYPSSFRDPYGYNNGPRCSPILTPQYCYTFGAEGVLLCLKLATGEVVWKRETQQDFAVPEGFFGVGSSPLLWGDKLIVMVGGQPNSGVVAFDARTGKTLWESVGKSTWDGVKTGWPSPKNYEWTGEEMVVSYSSPIPAVIHGHKHVLCLMRHGLVSVDPDTGAERFKYWFRSRVHESVNAASPVVLNDTVLISSEYRTGSALLKVQPDGNSFDVVWRNPRGLESHWATAIHAQDAFFGFSGHYEPEGRMTCIDAQTGGVKWESPGFDSPLDRYERTSEDEVVDRKTRESLLYPIFGRGSLTMADGKFIVMGERGGLMALMNPNPEKRDEIVGCRAPKLGYPTWAGPVVSRGRLYLRSQDWLICLDLRRAKQ